MSENKKTKEDKGKIHTELINTSICKYKESLNILGTDINYGHICNLSNSNLNIPSISSSWKIDNIKTLDDIFDSIDRAQNAILFIISEFNKNQFISLVSYLKHKLIKYHSFLIQFKEDLSMEDLLKIQKHYRKISIYSSVVLYDRSTTIIYPQ
jgi:hypothetical protein